MRSTPLLLMGVLIGCTQQQAYVPDKALPLDADGLPPLYSLCARNAAVKSAAIYDVFFGCRSYIISYLSTLNDTSQQAKAEMVDAMEPKALDYAQRKVVEFHGEAAVRAALMGEPPPPKPANRPAGY